MQGAARSASGAFATRTACQLIPSLLCTAMPAHPHPPTHPLPGAGSDWEALPREAEQRRRLWELANPQAWSPEQRAAYAVRGGVGATVASWGGCPALCRARAWLAGRLAPALHPRSAPPRYGANAAPLPNLLHHPAQAVNMTLPAEIIRWAGGL